MCKIDQLFKAKTIEKAENSIRCMTKNEINIKNTYGMTALMMTVLYDRPELMKLLLQTEGVEFNIKNTYGMTALMMTVLYDGPELMKLLLKHIVENISKIPDVLKKEYTEEIIKIKAFLGVQRGNEINNQGQPIPTIVELPCEVKLTILEKYLDDLHSEINEKLQENINGNLDSQELNNAIKKISDESTKLELADLVELTKNTANINSNLIVCKISKACGLDCLAKKFDLNCKKSLSL